MLLTPSPSPLHAVTPRLWVLVALVSLSAFVPQTSAFAQNGSYVKPTISVSEFYDDNLFMIPGAEPEADFVSRVSPGLEVGYRAPRGHLIGTYHFDAEIYPNHTDLNAPFVRQNVGLDLQYQVTPKVSFVTLGSYDRTHTPYDLAGVSGVPIGLSIGRFEADQLVINPQVVAQISGRTKALLGYRWVRDAFSEQNFTPVGVSGLASWMSEPSARVEHQVKGTTMLGVGYTLRQFNFGTGLSVRSQVFLAGVGHQFSPLTSIEVWAGPRVEPGRVRPEGTVTLRHQLQRGELTANYGQEQGTTLGSPVPLEVRTVSFQVSVKTSPRVEFAVGPSYFHTTDGTANMDISVYAGGAALTLHITQQLAMAASYSYARQTGTFGLFDQALRHQVALISFTVTPLRGVQF